MHALKQEAFSDETIMSQLLPTPALSSSFVTIRTEYLRARPPQQITQLKEVNLIFQKIGPPANYSNEQLASCSSTATFPLSVDENKSRTGIRDLEDQTIDLATAGNLGGEGGHHEDTKSEMASISSKLFQLTLGRCSTTSAEDESFLHPPIQYRIAFAKYVIKQLEESMSQTNGEDLPKPEEREVILEEWYIELETLLSGRQVLSEPFYRLYEIKVANSLGGRRAGEVVKIFENETSFVADGTTGLVTWEASIEFLKWLTSEAGESHLHPEESRWILEVGCGCGFLAVAVPKCRPKLEQYIATDGSLSALQQAKQNVDANFSSSTEDLFRLKSKIRFEKVDWQEETRESFTQLVDGMTSLFGAGKGILLGADIVFDPDLIPDLVELISNFVENQAGRAILSCTIRNETTMTFLHNQLVSRGLTFNICGTWTNGNIIEICLSK